jgi:transcriptional regulator with XRE-family HTH domain
MAYERLFPPGARRTRLRRKYQKFERQALIEAREKLGLSRPELAKKVGVARTFLWRVEIGEEDPSLSVLVKWLDALGPEASIRLFEPLPKLSAWAAVLSRDQHLA